MVTDREVLKELQVFTTKHAKKVTNKPVTVYIANHIPKYDLNKMLPEIANGSNKTAMEIVITTVMRDGKKEIYGYYIIVGEDFFSIYKPQRDILENGILHELSHIPGLLNRIKKGIATTHHGKQFKKTANKLGVPETHLKKSFKEI
jgi:hypothetical protein